MRHLVPILASFALACGSSHGPSESDAGSTGDGGSCSGSTPLCVTVSGHVCGDGLRAAACGPSGWVCAPGWTMQSTAGCWCYGTPPSPMCFCDAGGWTCPGGPDAGIAMCPPDPGAAIGTACSMEGQLCGNCAPCGGPCDQIQCTGGTWVGVFGPPTPRPALPCAPQFACGPSLFCVGYSQYCVHSVNDTGGPDSYGCVDLPAGCASCDCLPPANECTSDGLGGLTITYYGG